MTNKIILLLSLFFIFFLFGGTKQTVYAESVTVCNFCEHYQCGCNDNDPNNTFSFCYWASETNHYQNQYTSTCTPTSECGICNISNCNWIGGGETYCPSGGGDGEVSPPPGGGVQHKGCVGTSCQWVPGAGMDDCSNPGTNPAGQCSHFECNSSAQCVPKQGDGPDECDTNSDCATGGPLCNLVGDPCSSGSDCCSGLNCQGGNCCKPNGSACSGAGAGCCSGICSDGICSSSAPPCSNECSPAGATQCVVLGASTQRGGSDLIAQNAGAADVESDSNGLRQYSSSMGLVIGGIIFALVAIFFYLRSKRNFS